MRIRFLQWIAALAAVGLATWSIGRTALARDESADGIEFARAEHRTFASVVGTLPAMRAARLEPMQALRDG